MELVQIIALLSMATIAGLLVVFGYKEFKYRSKIGFLIHLVDKGYESENIDLDKL